ncbi:GNAT family N-acetyltransferase [Dongia rigui]|uniref:GNAT family N-acetyltransferase n=1 Tax=Dongia rigui TaxID=940149 RepID=A0ABU5DZA1_9PROT|nr:GNAT family N-acetyltransferase [Dongia rigui]MDY0872255.1 GNAT family N-acetyltransferase [Dongia rigui]
MPVTLRAATAADHAAIRALDPRLIAEAALPGATREDFRHFQRNVTEAALTDTNPKSRLIVAADESGAILGYMHVKPTLDDVRGCESGYLSIIAVAESAVGQGVGSMLMKAAEDWARGHGYPSLLLDVFASNATARRFYARAGFAEDSVRLRRPL